METQCTNTTCVSHTEDQNHSREVEPTIEVKVKQRRGFAILDQAKRQEIARKGGKLAHVLGRAHQFTREEAKVAGRKGGLARKGKTGTEG